MDELSANDERVTGGDREVEVAKVAAAGFGRAITKNIFLYSKGASLFKTIFQPTPWHIRKPKAKQQQ